VPVPDDQLPVRAARGPRAGRLRQSARKSKAFLDVQCPKCGAAARRETDTMDTFVDSSWYFLRFASPHNDERWSTRARLLDAGRPVHRRHRARDPAPAVFALLDRVMRDCGLTRIDEPFQRLLTQGMVLNEIWFRKPASGRSSTTTRRSGGDGEGARAAASCVRRHPVEYGGIGTMSKSRRNGVDPAGSRGSYGADTARLFTMSNVPPEAHLRCGRTRASRARSGS
jgi:leucyl-tRNA synthetase